MKPIIRSLRIAPFTFSIAAIAILAHFIGPLRNALELDRVLVWQGQWWRIWTGHITHFSAEHLFWDLGMFVVLGVLCERGRVRAFAMMMFAMSMVVSLVVGWTHPELTVYRGLSGLDTGLFTWFIIDQVIANLKCGNRRYAVLWFAGVLALLAKLVYEIGTGTTLFVDAGEFVPLVEAHLAGALVGMIPILAMFQSRQIAKCVGYCFN